MSPTLRRTRRARRSHDTVEPRTTGTTGWTEQRFEPHELMRVFWDGHRAGLAAKLGVQVDRPRFDSAFLEKIWQRGFDHPTESSVARARFRMN